MLAVGDRVLDEGVAVGDTGGLGKVDHGVRVVLLVARVCVRQQGVDPVDPCKLNAGLVGEDVTAANKL